MHLALIIDDYLPDSTRVASKMFHELACAFVNGGHRVTVITPYYGRGNRLKKNHLDGVEVWYFKKTLELKMLVKLSEHLQRPFFR